MEANENNQGEQTENNGINPDIKSEEITTSTVSTESFVPESRLKLQRFQSKVEEVKQEARNVNK